MSDFLLVVPLIVVLALLLPPFRLHVIVAGLVGGVLAVIIGGLDLGQAADLFMDGSVELIGIEPIILFAATAMVLARAGSMSSTLKIIENRFKGRVELVVTAMVIVQALSVYVAGTGAGNTLITAPLILAAIGFNSWVVGALSVASAAAWSVSPAAAESAFISQAMGMSVADYVAFMRPYAVIIWLLAAILAYIGVVKAKKEGTLKPGLSDGSAGAPEDVGKTADGAELGDKNVEPWKRSLPFFLLLVLIVFSPIVNNLTGMELLSPLTIPLVVLVVMALLVKVKFNIVASEFIESSKIIMGYLFMAGVFLGFINMLTEIGTFEVLANLPAGLPIALLGLGGLVISFFIAIPAAAYTTAVLIFVVPVLQAIGVPTAYFGFVTMIVALGAMISPVQVNVAASAHGFQTTILRIVSNNLRFVPAAAIIVLIMSQIAVYFF